MKLIIVESPTKCETIKKYLGDDFCVVASYGHIRDLSITGKGGLGVDIEDDFKPTYNISKDKLKVVNNLRKAAKEADVIYLATDPDREGEAISWHLADVLNLDVELTKRLEFHEITKSAILKAIENPRVIDLDLVASQETRRIIDRIIGFKLSKLMKKKVGSMSAGRVQSVTLKLITEREEEIEAFVPEEYWTIKSSINKFDINLETYNNKKIEIKTEEEASNIVKEIPEVLKVKEVNKYFRFTDSKTPFKTSVLQQVAYTSCKFSTKMTQSYAQKLFELGLITYIRTDGTKLSKEFIEHAKKFIVYKYGNDYLASEAKLKSLENNDKSNMAHEAIRPTSLDNTPELVRETYKLDKKLYDLYNLIYKRSLASLMSPKKEEVTNIKLEGNKYGFTYTGVKVAFDGYSKVYKAEEEENDKVILECSKGENVKRGEVITKQHFTTGPTRYNEAKLVKMMEEVGIGRPSTYASTIATLYAREYIKNEKGNLIPTEQGRITTKKLNEFFPPFMETSYTAAMESNLDDVSFANGTRSKILNDFYKEFESLFINAQQNMEKEQPKTSGNLCPQCGKPLVFRKSKYGQFEACSGFPECNYVKKPDREPLVYSDKLCPKCGKPLVLRKSKKGEFYACSGYPRCNYIDGQDEIAVENETNLSCPKCGKPMVRKKGKRGKSDFYACSGFPSCKHIQSINEEK